MKNLTHESSKIFNCLFLYVLEIQHFFLYSTEASHPSKSGGCFTANSTVMSSDGSRLKLSELKIGDSVLSVNSVSGELEFSPIILFLDRDPNEARQFFTIQTESGHSLTLTPWTFRGPIGRLRNVSGRNGFWFIYYVWKTS